ncbi:hypothetical protein O1611_g7849 [Lasiodiplodia mahajangana]|uniref:Uncharacterized protein n=1 Tax=Lasiodiplodia mahajangana TaxID=1108764 RepID=A0ACC2JEK2_9PEZI|nr:hypothetical protein O1611_g7849 [Lasiodiplodia mahajangana]
MAQPLSKMASLDPAVLFGPYFNMLPPELRQLIWKEAALTSMDNPEVLILVPSSVRIGMYSIDKSSPFPPVNTAFPAVMHVNREARHIAKMNITLADIGPYPWKKCRVPQRPFRPEIDTFYASRTIDPQFYFCRNDLGKVQHLAIDCDPGAQDLVHMFMNVIKCMPALRTIRRVLPSTLGNWLVDSPPCLPHRRCMLRPWTEAGAQMIVSKRGPKNALNYVSPLRLNSDTFTDYNPTIVQPLLQGPIPQQPLALVHYPQESQPRYILAADIPSPLRGLESALRFAAAKHNIKLELCLITEFCYSTFGDSRFVAVGEKFPNSPDPSTFASLNASKCPKDLIDPRMMSGHLVSRKRKGSAQKASRGLHIAMASL